MVAKAPMAQKMAISGISRDSSRVRNRMAKRLRKYPATIITSAARMKSTVMAHSTPGESVIRVGPGR